MLIYQSKYTDHITSIILSNLNIVAQRINKQWSVPIFANLDTFSSSELHRITGISTWLKVWNSDFAKMQFLEEYIFLWNIDYRTSTEINSL